MFKNIVLFAHKEGQKKIGVEKTPAIFKSFITKNDSIKSTMNYQNLYKNINNLYNINSKLENPILNVGGDHSLSIASVADSLKKYNNLKVIWMDAHCDINTYESSLSKNFHGIPLSVLTGLDIETRKSFSYFKNVPTLDFKNILYLGVRDIDPYEKEILHKYNIEYINVNEINNFPYNVLNKIEEFVKNDPIHFSFDVDALDPKYIPCTGTPSSDGICLESCGILLQNIIKYNLVSMDVVELNLEIGNNDDKIKSLNNIKHLMKGIVY